ncbi:MAG: hypothetical protein DA408_11845 [Bacteroidetes bacterium]|nr:MAG: hypothetical protein C7N36_19385 [Bacteroidota bacterium]PTM12137.1 MAG: hypothetical protein DA408_11845 [Bacteroidota bacterium]
MRKLFALTLLFTLVCAACYEPVEGCLNPRAANFDLDADEACGDCCVFPKLKIRFENYWTASNGTVSSLSPDSIYYDGLDQPFRFKRIRFYWSELELELTSGSRLSLTDSIELAIAQGGDTTLISTLDNFLLADIDRATRNLTLKTLEPTGFLAALNAQFGIPDPVNRTVTASVVPTNHPLAPQIGSMNLGAELGYVFAKIELYRDTISTDTVPLVLQVFGTQFLRPLRLPLATPAYLAEGFNPLLVIENDISRWFQGVNVRQSDTTALKLQFVNNLTQSFTLRAVLAE